MRIKPKLGRRDLDGRAQGRPALCLRTTQQRLVVVRVSELYNEADETRFRLTGTVWA